ncbi:MAG: hypothetical protein N2544_07620 [Burkholderiales bacterium]|nr:hypothetical protein [Burkholderiales bacterium]
MSRRDRTRRFRALAAVRSRPGHCTRLVDADKVFGGGWVDEAARFAPQPSLAAGAIRSSPPPAQ